MVSPQQAFYCWASSESRGGNTEHSCFSRGFDISHIQNVEGRKYIRVVATMEGASFPEVCRQPAANTKEAGHENAAYLWVRHQLLGELRGG